MKRQIEEITLTQKERVEVHQHGRVFWYAYITIHICESTHRDKMSTSDIVQMKIGWNTDQITVPVERLQKHVATCLK